MRTKIIIAGLSGAMAVAMGAWAAHGLGGDPVAQELVQKGAHYQLTHALALIAASHLGAKAASWLFGVGLILFPLTLYILAMGGPAWVKALTPMGGTAFIGGWLALTYWGIKQKA